MQNAGNYEYSSYSEWLGKKEIIDSQCAKLIYGVDEYLEVFLKQHLNKKIVDINDIDEEINFAEVISEYLHNENISIEMLNNNEEYLKEVIKELKKNSNISARKLSEILNINRPKITKILKKME